MCAAVLSSSRLTSLHSVIPQALQKDVYRQTCMGMSKASKQRAEGQAEETLETE